MKRYLLFGGNAYPPGGGWNDFKNSYDTADTAQAAAEGQLRYWWQVVDGTTGTIIVEHET